MSNETDEKYCYTPKELRDAFVRGLIEGVTLYAWWKDGVQYVGTCGKTLEEAIEQIKKDNPITIEQTPNNCNGFKNCSGAFGKDPDKLCPTRSFGCFEPKI